MPASEAQVRANQANAQKPTSPKTAEGQDLSRANADKHGLTASKIVPEREAAEIDRRSAAFVNELNPSGEVGLAMARHAARMSVRMERCAEQENAAITARVRTAFDEFVPPEGVTDEAEVKRFRQEAERLALFDASKEATLARKYEASAERSFFRSLKELRLHEKRVKAVEEVMMAEELGSFFPGEMTDEEFDALNAEPLMSNPREQGLPAGSVDFSTLKGRVDVPITVGLRR